MRQLEHDAGIRGPAGDGRAVQVPGAVEHQGTPAARQRYSDEWQNTQARFVGEPAAAVRQADVLVISVMRDRGYPMEDFDQRSADISVDHPQVVHNYRAAHAISMANDHGRASTEDMRQALVYYRSLFDELLSRDQGEEEIQRQAR